MPAPRQRKESIWVTLAWTLNLLGLGGIAFVGIAYVITHPTFFASAQEAQPIPTIGLPNTFTPDPNALYLPTVTPNPKSTMIVVQTPTPFILSGGKRPQVIGYSVSGRPIEVYIFGNGESQRMIVAGIHGGYEWNTIALADELITHIYENPEIIPSDVTLYILRNLNPDGDARDHGARTGIELFSDSLYDPNKDRIGVGIQPDLRSLVRLHPREVSFVQTSDEVRAIEINQVTQNVLCCHRLTNGGIAAQGVSGNRRM